MRIDVSQTSSSRTSSPSAKKSSGGDSSQKIKMVVAIVVGVLAIGLIVYQVMPMISSGRRASAPPPEDITQPVQANSPDLAPGTHEAPIQPKPRGAGKRPAGG